jgi:hypothetical protein
MNSFNNGLNYLSNQCNHYHTPINGASITNSSKQILKITLISAIIKQPSYPAVKRYLLSNDSLSLLSPFESWA